MSQKSYPLQKIIITSQNRAPWTPVKLCPYREGPRSFWSCYTCSNYDPVRTQIVAPTWCGSREKGGIAALDSVTLWRESKLSKEIKTVLAVRKWKRVKKKRKWTVFLLPPMFLFVRGKLNIFAFMYKTFVTQVSLKCVNFKYVLCVNECVQFFGMVDRFYISDILFRTKVGKFI